MDERTFCCPACRLLQPAGTECIECGAPIGEISASAALLRYRVAGDVTRRKVELGAAAAGVGVATATSIASVVLLGPVAWAALPIIAYTSLVGTGALASLRARKYSRIVAIDVPDPATGDGAITRTGIARPLTGPAISKLDGEPILSEQVVIRDGGSILLRRVYATPFVVTNDPDPDEVVVLGEVRLTTPAVTRELARTDPMFTQLGIPTNLLPKTVTVDVRTIRPGTFVSVRGVTEDATLHELAYHRDGGQALAMRGRRGSMVVVSLP